MLPAVRPEQVEGAIIAIRRRGRRRGCGWGAHGEVNHLWVSRIISREKKIIFFKKIYYRALLGHLLLQTRDALEVGLEPEVSVWNKMQQDS